MAGTVQVSITLGLVGFRIQIDSEKLYRLERSVEEPAIWAPNLRYRVCPHNVRYLVLLGCIGELRHTQAVRGECGVLSGTSTREG